MADPVSVRGAGPEPARRLEGAIFHAEACGAIAAASRAPGPAAAGGGNAHSLGGCVCSVRPGNVGNLGERIYSVRTAQLTPRRPGGFILFVLFMAAPPADRQHPPTRIGRLGSSGKSAAR